MYAHQSLPAAMRFGLLPNGCENCGGVQGILMDQKLIQALCFDIPRRKRLERKISEVKGSGTIIVESQRQVPGSLASVSTDFLPVNLSSAANIGA